MLTLSPKAKTYLTKLERVSSTIDRQAIIDSFISNDAPVFEPLITFQQNYSGYQLMAGLVPIQFGLLQGDGGYPVRTGTAIIDFELSETNSSKYLFVCAISEIPINLMLDEYGRLYQDLKIVASSFDKFVEHQAILDEIENDGSYKVLIEGKRLKIIEIDRLLSLKMIPEASDAYTLWFKDDSIYMTQTNGQTTIFAAKNFDKINSVINA